MWKQLLPFLSLTSFFGSGYMARAGDILVSFGLLIVGIVVARYASRQYDEFY